MSSTGIKGRFQYILGSLKDDWYIFSIVFLLALIQLVYDYVPLIFIVNVVVTLGILIYLNIKQKGKPLLIIKVLIPILAIGFWALYNFNNYSYINGSITKLLIIIYVWQLCAYFFKDLNFATEFKQRLINFLIAVIFGLVFFLILNCFVALFNLVIPMPQFAKDVCLRGATSLSVLAFFSIFVTYKFDETKKDSKFFITMFKVILPTLLFLLSVIYAIYSIKVYYLNQTVETIKNYLFIVYILGFLGFIVYALTGKFKEKYPKVLLNISFILTSMIMVLNYENIISKNTDISRIFDIISYNKVEFIQMLIIFSAIALYSVGILIFNKFAVNKRVGIVAIIIAIVLVLPVFGHNDADKIAHSDASFKVIALNKMDNNYFNEFYKKGFTLRRNKNDNPDYEYAVFGTPPYVNEGNIIDGNYVNDDTKKEFNRIPESLIFEQNTEGMRNYNISNYKNLFLDVSMVFDSENDVSETKFFSDYKLYFKKHDPKNIVIENINTGNRDVFNVYDAAIKAPTSKKEDFPDRIYKNPEEPLKFYFKGGVIIIKGYKFEKTFRKDNENKILINRSLQADVLTN